MSLEQVNERSYGAGSAGADGINATPPSWRQRMRYRFDTSVAKSPFRIILWLLLFAILVTIVIAVLFWPLGQVGGGTLLNKMYNALWTASDFTIWYDFAPIGAPAKYDLLFALGYPVAAVVTALVIALMTVWLTRFTERLSQGRTPVLESGHTVIVGWSNRIFPIVQQLCVANENQRKPLIVVIAPGSVDEMRDEIKERVGDLKGTRLMVRNADTANPAAMTSANVRGARSVIVLGEPADDASIVESVLAVLTADPDSTTSIITEIESPMMRDVLHKTSRGRVKGVHAKEIITHVVAQASRLPGLTAVVLDFLDFEGDELYFQEIPQLVGTAYGDALLGFEKSSVIGLRHGDGRVALNPDASTVIAAGDAIIAVSEDDDTVIYQSRDPRSQVRPQHTDRVEVGPRNLLMIGWSDMGERLASELAAGLPSGARITVVAESGFVASEPAATYGAVPVTYRTITQLTDVVDVLSADNFDEVLVTAYRAGMSETEADAHTLLTVMLLNHYFESHDVALDRVRVVAEVLDSRRNDLARAARPDDFVVSDNLTALFMCQVAENPSLLDVFEEIFSTEKVRLQIHPVEAYAAVGSSVEYADLVAAARARGESAIGYRRAQHPVGDPAQGVLLNPAKSQRVTIEAGDGVVVVA